MRPVSPSDPPAVAAAGGGPRNRSRSRTRARKASSVVIESKEWEKIYHQQSNEEVEEEFEKMLVSRGERESGAKQRDGMEKTSDKGSPADTQ